MNWGNGHSCRYPWSVETAARRPVKPKYVTILLGMNDGSYNQHSQAAFQIYEEEMTRIIEKIADLGAQPILITPTMFDVRSHGNAIAGGFQDSRKRSPYYNGVLAYYGAWLREQAFEKGLGFVDMRGPLNRRRSNNANWIRILLLPSMACTLILLAI